MVENLDYLNARLRQAWPDAEALRALRREVEYGAGLPENDRAALLQRIAADLLAVESAVGLRDVPSDDLRRRH